jgi:hypothetical protein
LTPSFFIFAVAGVQWRMSHLRSTLHSTLRLLVVLCLSLGASLIHAKPVGPRLFCSHYPDVPACRGAVVACTGCHTAAPELNDYGSAVASALTGAYEDTIDEALVAVEGDDSDGDGLSNLEELVLGTRPGDAASHFTAPLSPSGPANPRFDVGHYDPAFAFRRLHIAYCGRSPTYDEQQAFSSSTNKPAALHTALDACLASPYWLQEGLAHLADKRIRPLQAIAVDGQIPLADYRWDYRLWVYALSGTRDARDLLRADYHIDDAGNVVEGVIDGVGGDAVGGQPTAVEKRAGMITTQWFLMINTMFSELPRTTAAQAYRAYLGQDIARSEGLLPVEGEPKDIDNRGVDQETCTYCHATLDPLSYAFAYYNGIGGPGGTGAYRPGRPTWRASDVEAAILDQPLTNVALKGVTEWADVAADSAQFRQNIATMFLVHALGRAVRPDELDELQELADRFVDDNYRAEALLHRLIDTNAFGVP